MNEILLIIRHQVAHNSRRYGLCCIVNLDPSVSMRHRLRFAEVSQPDVRTVSLDRETSILRLFKYTKITPQYTLK